MNKILKHITTIAAAGMLMASCSTPKPALTVFKDLETNVDGSLPVEVKQLTVKPHDELLINVSSTEPTATAQYNPPLTNPARVGTLMSPTPSQMTYIVSDNGDIDFPVLGRLHVAGMTTQAIASMIEKRVEADVKDPLVIVQLLNFKVNVLGEVARPGSVASKSERFTILDAIASAGYLTEYGDRTNVLLVREENGKAEYHHIDLTKSDVVSSPYYYMQQNDVVMVAPTQTRESNARYDTNASYRMQVVSTIVSAASVIASLVIALTVK